MTDPVRIGPFPGGADNRRSDEELWSERGGALLRAASNVDVTDEGRLRRRKGFALASGESVPQDFPVALPIVRTHSTSGQEILSNDDLRDLMNPQPRALSCKHFGRYVAAFGDTLFFSDPYLDGDEFGRGARTTADRNFLPFRGQITAVFSTDDGLYVGSDATYFIAGDVQGSAPLQVHPAQIIQGSVTAIAKEKRFAWISSQGPVTGSAGGQVEALAADHLETGFLPPTLTGTSLYRVAGGLRQLVMTLHGAPDASAAVSSDFMDAEVIRNEVNYGHGH
ncbi:hypothetical protein AVME950_02240 [Acidovorax sp. SUPP950]|uniref:hypothetical protein n=1 Tax=Acidovorax sp. SUPP950 TaxID=511901 RepID=UPI0023C940CA|nr:hypothetical protein [Acidovorax sp. SUPP950]GKS73666.1 hypothetical protein AVME950_02240 [Acidovorax sp. SUPP950]